MKDGQQRKQKEEPEGRELVKRHRGYSISKVALEASIFPSAVEEEERSDNEAPGREGNLSIRRK